MDNRFLDAFKEFLGSRSSTVERSSTRTAAAGTFLRFFQTIFENTPLWRLKRLVTLSTYRRYINECIYLSIQSKRLFTTFRKGSMIFVISSSCWEILFSLWTENLLHLPKFFIRILSSELGIFNSKS